MNEPEGDLASRLARVEEELRFLRARLDRLEASRGPGAEARDEPRAASAPDKSLGSDSLEGIRLAGRTVLTLAGGYLIRALTDSGTLSPRAGVACGFAYALAFTFLAHRAGRAGQRASADFHALAGALMVYPLLVETSVRLGWLQPRLALLGLVLAFAANHLVALSHRIRFMAWLGTLLAAATGLVLLLATHDLLACVLTLLAVAAIVESATDRGLEPGVRFVAGVAVDVAVLVLVFVFGGVGDLPEGYAPLGLMPAALLALALPALYLVSIALETLGRGHPVGIFEVSQAAAALTLGFGGGAQILHAHGASAAPVAAAAIVLGGLAYTVAFAFVERRFGQAANFYFYSTAGGLLSLLGCAWLLQEPVWVFSGMALAAAWFGRRYDRQTLRYHSVAYLAAGASTSGLLSLGLGHMLGRELGSGGLVPSPSAWLALGAILASYCLLAPGGQEGPARARMPQALVAALLVIGLEAALVGTLAGVSGAVLSGPWLATIRTGVLAALSLGVAEAGRRFARRELEWLVYPMLALGGLKLLMEDLPSGRAAALSASFLLYGTALTLAPRLARASRGEASRE